MYLELCSSPEAGKKFCVVEQKLDLIDSIRPLISVVPQQDLENFQSWSSAGLRHLIEHTTRNQ